MAIGAATVGICIAVACVLFLLVSMILIYNNAQYERKRLQGREILRLGKIGRRGSVVPGAFDIEANRSKPKPPSTTTKVTPINNTPATATVAAAAVVGASQLDAKADDGVADSGLETDTAAQDEASADSKPLLENDKPNSAPDPTAVAAGTAYVMAAAAAAAAATTAATTKSPEPSEDKEEDAKPETEQPGASSNDGFDEDALPSVAVPVAEGEGVVAMAMVAAEEPVRPESKKKEKKKPEKNKLVPKMEVNPEEPQSGAASDFDDYRDMRPRHLPPPQDHKSPPPAQYRDPDPSPAVSQHNATSKRKKGASKRKDKEGMDF